MNKTKQTHNILYKYKLKLLVLNTLFDSTNIVRCILRKIPLSNHTPIFTKR